MTPKEAFQKLKGYVPLDWEETKLVKTALNRLEELDKVIPLNNRKLAELDDLKENYKLVKKTLDEKMKLNGELIVENAKLRKVLKIIKEKEVSIVYLKHTKNVIFYNAHFRKDKTKHLTETDFNLLKEYLK